MSDSMKDKLKEFFKSYSGHAAGFDENLFDSGAIDSMGVLELLNFLIEEFKVSVDPESVTEENLSTINAISSLVIANQS